MNKRLLWLFPLVFCMGATECQLEDEDGLGEEEDIEFRTLQYTDGRKVRGAVSGVTSAQLVVIRDVDAFTDMWATHASGFAPQPAQPNVAFGDEMVVAAFAGERESDRYEIEIQEVRENNQFINVDIELRTPGSNCEVSQNATQPNHVVLIDDSDKPVNFIQNTVRSGPCE